jgi:hypothetical protein
MVITTKTILRMGSTETANIKILQHKLGIKEDGVYGPVTRDTIKAKQKALGLLQDGIAGPITLRALGLIPSVPINKSAFHLMVEDHVGFKYNTFLEFFNDMSSKGYAYYNNDIYPQGQALDRLKSNSGLKCADVSQIGYAVAKDLNLEAHYGHIKCQQGGHIVLILGTIKNGTVYDLAKKISTTSGPTKPGDYWCKSTGYLVSYDDSWLTGGPNGDDGIT